MFLNSDSCNTLLVSGFASSWAVNDVILLCNPLGNSFLFTSFWMLLVPVTKCNFIHTRQNHLLSAVTKPEFNLLCVIWCYGVDVSDFLCWMFSTDSPRMNTAPLFVCCSAPVVTGTTQTWWISCYVCGSNWAVSKTHICCKCFSSLISQIRICLPIKTLSLGGLTSSSCNTGSLLI